MRPRLLVATHSAHKLAELRELLQLEHGELVSLEIIGGWLGRVTVVAALELRRTLRSAALRAFASVLAPAGARH